MSRGAKILAALLVLAVAASAVWLLLVPKDAPTGAVARITQNGELLEEIPLEEVEEPYSFTITGENGAENTVSVERGRISISHASCPDQVCVNQGWISNGVVPIVCLPNGIVIEITGGGEDLDAANG